MSVRVRFFVLICMFGLGFQVHGAGAATFSTTAYNQPGAVITRATGINKSGVVVGVYQNLSFGVFTEYGYIRKPTESAGSVIAAPGWDITRPTGVNDVGQVIGAVFSKTASATRSFIYQAGRWTFFDTPASGAPEAINSSGKVVGSFLRGSYPISSCFLRAGTTVQTIDPVGANSCLAHAINQTGAAVGEVLTAGGWRGFYRTSTGRVTLLSYPGAVETHAYALNGSNIVVGSYLDAAHAWHGFKWVSGVYTRLDFPGATYTVASAINKIGSIAGTAIVAGQQSNFILIGTSYQIVPQTGGAVNPIITGFNDVSTVIGDYSSSVLANSDATFKSVCSGTHCH